MSRLFLIAALMMPAVATAQDANGDAPPVIVASANGESPDGFGAPIVVDGGNEGEPQATAQPELDECNVNQGWDAYRAVCITQ